VRLIYVPNKKNGTTYVYESTNYWDKKTVTQQNGATYLFDRIGKSLDITADLKACFPENFK